MAKTKTRKAAAPSEPPKENILDVDISGVMRESFSEYAATVVVNRAIADVRDGLKPVHRRVLYAMKIGGYDWTAGYWKSARIVGDTMGIFHPHGDSAIYDAMARLTQTWSVTAPLIDGQGNFGSADGDNPAAMRYTEARLAKISRFLLEEINRDTVDFRPNYDDKTVEPVVLPAAFPNALVNGGSGIAVGMASSVAPHNLGEVIDATLLRLNKPDCTVAELMEVCPGPDFPTGGRIIGNEGIIKAYNTGRGTLTIEASTHFEKDGRNPLIVYTDMPWGKNRPDLLAKINSMILEGKMPDIVSARDETDRQGPRFVVELRVGADPDYVDRILKTQTDLRTGVGLNFTLLDRHGVPREMGLADILDEWLAFRRLTIRRRATFDLKKARDRGRAILGRIAALSIIDRVVKIIRTSKSSEEALDGLCAINFTSADFAELVELLGTKEQRKGKRFQLSREQGQDILDMRLRRLTGLEREALEEEARKIVDKMIDLREILSVPTRLDSVVAEELSAVRGAVDNTDRRTVIDGDAEALTARAAAPIAPLEKTHILFTPDGLVGRAKKGRPDEMVAKVVASDTHSKVLFFTDDGVAYGVDVSDLPALESKEDPRAIPGVLGLTPSGSIIETLVVSSDALAEPDKGGAVLTFVSQDGYIRRTNASEFSRIPQGGKMAMKISEADPRLLTVFQEAANEDLKEGQGYPAGGAVFMGTAKGRIIRFGLSDLRIMAGRSSRGVRGLKLDKDDFVVSAFEVPDLTLSAELVDEIEKGWLGKTRLKFLSDEAKALQTGPEILQIARTGHAKKTLLHAYRQTRRDNRGINDRGPAKTIGDMIGYQLIQEDTVAVHVVTGDDMLNDMVIPAVDDIRRGAKATTGGIIVEEARKLF
jgi:DNA gyrase subunit A